MGYVCCGASGCDEQIHMEYRSPVEKKGWHGHPLSERVPGPLPGQVFIAFPGTLQGGWSSFTMHRFGLGDYLLQIIKEKMLLITTKKRILQVRGEKWFGKELVDTNWGEG